MALFQNPRDLPCNFPLGVYHQFHIAPFPITDTYNTVDYAEPRACTVGLLPQQPELAAELFPTKLAGFPVSR